MEKLTFKASLRYRALVGSLQLVLSCASTSISQERANTTREPIATKSKFYAVADTSRKGVAQTFMVDVIEKKRRLWIRVPQSERGGGCKPFSFTTLAVEGEYIRSATKELVVANDDTCMDRYYGYGVHLNIARASVSFLGPSNYLERRSNCTPKKMNEDLSGGGLGCAWVFDLLEKNDNGYLVANYYPRQETYIDASEIVAWYYEKEDCENDKSSRLSDICKLDSDG